MELPFTDLDGSKPSSLIMFSHTDMMQNMYRKNIRTTGIASMLQSVLQSVLVYRESGCTDRK